MAFSSFNAYGSASNNSEQIGKPVWLGTVAPHAVGGVIASAFRKAGALYSAGTPVNLSEGVITPLVAFKVVSFSAGDGSTTTVDTVVVKPASFGGAEIAPAADDVLQPLGATFAATGKAAVVASSSLVTSGDNEGCYTITVLHSANLGNLTAGAFLVYSASATAGSSKSMKNQPNGYLYNDIYLGDLSNPIATGAVVDFHGEGLLIDFTPASDFADAMKAAVPNVVQYAFPESAFVTI